MYIERYTVVKKKSENKSFNAFVTRKSKEVTVVYTATISKGKHSSGV